MKTQAPNGASSKEVNFVPYQLVRPVYTVSTSASIQVHPLFHTGKNTGRTGLVPTKSDYFSQQRCFGLVQTRRKKKKKRRRRWEKWVSDSLTWCLMTEICALNLSFFFPSIPFSNLDPIPLHCSCHCNFFILLLLLLFSCVFSLFTTNAQLRAFCFVSFKFSYLIFSQWSQIFRWNYETLQSVEYFSNLSLVSIHFHQPRGLYS